MKLYFYTKAKCPLCDKGLDIVHRLNNEYSFQLELRDIYTNDSWLEVYQIRIPVVENDRGEVLDEGILSYEQLKRKLELN